MPVEIRIFVGMVQDSELRMHLKQSDQWKEDQLLENKPLIVTQSMDKEYIGIYLPPCISCQDLKNHEIKLRSQVQHYCPKLKVEHRRLYLFTQVFIG
jgi:hypothetical protein